MNNIKSQIKKKKEKNGGIVELQIITFFQKNASDEGTKTFLGKNIKVLIFRLIFKFLIY